LLVFDIPRSATTHGSRYKKLPVAEQADERLRTVTVTGPPEGRSVPTGVPDGQTGDVVIAPGGTVTTIERPSGATLTTVAGVLLNRTSASAVEVGRFVPRIVTDVPAAPWGGEIPVIVMGWTTYVKMPPEAVSPVPRFVTVTGPDAPEQAGGAPGRTRISLSETEMTDAATVPTVTRTGDWKPCPKMVSCVR